MDALPTRRAPRRAGRPDRDPALEGHANFGFVAKYQRGATVPTGNTEFQFKAAGLNFSSASYDWLVVAGAKAQYKGTGTINGEGAYGFMLTAIDGSLLGDQPDRFRMKITDPATSAVVYDNQMGADDDADPSTALGGGSIVIHKPHGVGPAAPPDGIAESTSALPVEYSLSAGEPNPFRGSTVLRFALPERSSVQLTLFDLAGRVQRVVARGEMEAGTHALRLTRSAGNGSGLRAGMYFLRMDAGSLQSGRRFAGTRKLVIVN